LFVTSITVLKKKILDLFDLIVHLFDLIDDLFDLIYTLS